jgi:hypothetical protein
MTAREGDGKVNCNSTARQEQRQQQIPFGDDNKKGKATASWLRACWGREADFSTALPTKAWAASVEMTGSGLG